MLMWIFPRNDETGVLDNEFKDGDVMQVKPDAFLPAIGAQEKKSWLIVQIPDPPNPSNFEAEVLKSEYAPGPTAGDDPVMRRARAYRVNWREKFTAAEIAAIENAAQTLPDGPNVQNGVVVAGFSHRDISRK